MVGGGCITLGDILRYSEDELEKLTAGEICNKTPKYICAEGEMIYLHARNLFAEYTTIQAIPVINESQDVIDIVTRWQAFYKQHYLNKELIFMPYAYNIWNAAQQAASLGYKRISVIEFGVAGGRGLVMCELHAKEISRIFDIDIEVYGFDTGVGLPKIRDYRDIPFIFVKGQFKMDIQKLQDRLQKAKLIIGDIRDTAKTFFLDCNPAPIGAMMVDVDLYSSTVSILNMFLEKDDFFLPRVFMYFDDLYRNMEYQGEILAVKEFNQTNVDMKICPELGSQDIRILGRNEMTQLKECHRFEHPKYCLGGGNAPELDLSF